MLHSHSCTTQTGTTMNAWHTQDSPCTAMKNVINIRVINTESGAAYMASAVQTQTKQPRLEPLFERVRLHNFSIKPIEKFRIDLKQ